MHTQTVPARLIKAVTRYGYSHVVLALEKDCETTYSFGRRQVHSVLHSGFITERKDGAFFSHFDKTSCRIYELEVTEEQYAAVERRLRIMQKSPMSYKYDYLGLMLRPIRLLVRSKHRYMCSNFVASLLEDAGVHHFDKPTYRIAPRDFGKQGFHQIYSGSYASYSSHVRQ